MSSFRVLLIPGSLRRRSTTTAALRTALIVAPRIMAMSFYDGLGRLPHFNPDDDRDTPPAEVGRLRHAIHEADALLFSTPEYAGDLPGSFKNLLDWTIGDDQPGSLYEKPVAWINVSPRGAVHAHDALRRVLGYAHATIVESACADVPVVGAMVNDDGLVADTAAQQMITGALGRLLDYLDSMISIRLPNGSST
jgi:chromate reductase